MKLSTCRRSYELGTLCARADRLLGFPAVTINAKSLSEGNVHADKSGCGYTFIAGYNIQVLKYLGVPTRATYRTVVKTTDKFWR